jgi:hypothetical protein
MGEWQRSPDVATAIAKKRGRKSKNEEARQYLRELGIDPDELVPADAKDDPVPETDSEFFAEFKGLLWQQRHNLKGTAFTQAINALAKWAEASKVEESQAAVQPTVAEIIAGSVLLPVARKREILGEALAELERERAAIAEVLEGVGLVPA